MPCSACRVAKERRKARLESRRKHAAAKEAERIQRAAEAQKRNTKVKYTDAAGN